MFSDFKNRFDFFLRNLTKFSRKNYKETDKNLIETNLAQNLYTKDILEKCFKKNSKNNLRILDIGCKNWFYAKGEYDFFNSFCENFTLEGVEIDPYRLYSNFYSRFEVAKYYIKGLKNTKYICGDLLDLEQKYDYIIWILPFVTVEPLIYWGLPQKFFNPKKLLEHACSLLGENGQILIINQGENEAQIQKQMFREMNVKFLDLGEIESEYFQYKNKRFGFLIEKIHKGF